MVAGPAVAQVVPDGRTQTSVVSSGSVTEVTTRTVSGANGLNSFSSFQVGGGQTVNLQLPSGTANLINLVRDAPVRVDGILNSYKNGAIGGNVYFADPYGFVVGAGGVINVGSLAVSTPTAGFLDRVIDPQGRSDASAMAQLMAGEAPLSETGNIVIRGQINALDAVRMYANAIVVTAPRLPGTRHRRIFYASVNTDLPEAAAAIVAENGDIELVAANDIRINGTLAANGAAGRSAGAIGVHAGRDVAIGSQAVLSAAGQGEHSSGGSVHVLAGRDTTVAAGAEFIASAGATGDGGAIDVSAKGRETLGGATYDTSAAAGWAGAVTFDPTDLDVTQSQFVTGGAATFSADNSVTFEAGVIINSRVVSGASVTAAALATALSTGDSGAITVTAPTITLKAGSQLLAFANNGKQGGAITLTASPSVANPLLTPSIDIAGTIWGGSVSLTAGTGTASTFLGLGATGSGTITVENGGTINTRTVAAAGDPTSAAVVSTASSGKIEATASTINVNAGGKIVAFANGATFKGGDIGLTVTSNSSQDFGAATATTAMTVAGLVSGRNVSLFALSSGLASMTDSTAGMAALPAADAIGLLLGLNANYLAGTAHATLTIGSGANLAASGNLTIAALSQAAASDPAVTSSTLGGGPFGASAVVGLLVSTANATVQSGATLISGGNLTVQAQNLATLDIGALTVSTGSTFFDATVAYGSANVNATAAIASGVALNVGGTLSVNALNTNSFSISASTSAFGGGRNGVALAIGNNLITTATATLGSSVGTAQSSPSAVLVQAVSDTALDKVSATTTVGSNAIVRFLTSLPNGTWAQGATGSSTQNSFFGGTGGTSQTKFAAATALNLGNTQSATAEIAADPGAAAPTILAGGAVGVVAEVLDRQVRNIADSGVSSTSVADATVQDPAATIGASFGVAYGSYTHNATALIGSGVKVTGSNIGVAATTDMPLDNTWLAFLHPTGVTDELTDLLSHLNGNVGAANDVASSWANASGTANNLAVNGSLNLFFITNHATAWVDSNTRLTATDSGSWSLPLASFYTHDTTLNPDPVNYHLDSAYTGLVSTATLPFSAPVTIAAAGRTQTIDIAGNISIFLNGSGGEGNNATALGGSFAYIENDTTTTAGIGSGADVTSSGDVAVTATTNDSAIAISPTSGRGASGAGNLIAALYQNADTTHASIDRAASITAKNVTVAAEQDLALLTVAGAITLANSAGVGCRRRRRASPHRYQRLRRQQ